MVYPDSDEGLTILTCDVSGHDVGSALVANRMYSETLHARERRMGPGTLLRQPHDFVQDQIALGGFFFTMAAARFSQQGRHVTFAGAGHPPAVLVTNGTPRLIHSQNSILGCLSEIAPSESVNEIELAKGDRLILYTDGGLLTEGLGTKFVALRTSYGQLREGK